MKTFKRDYVYLNELRSAAHVLAQLPGWLRDHNEVHPHKELGMYSPREYRERSRVATMTCRVEASS